MMPYRTRCPALPWLGKLLSAKLGACLILPMLLMSGCQTPLERNAREAAVARATKGKALFEEKCRTSAGKKIYRTVPDVEGVVLLKVRPRAGEREWRDRMWPGAAFAIEASGDSYIATFLGYEYVPGNDKNGKPGVLSAQNRGYINVERRPGGRPGYRFVDVISGEDGKTYRYTSAVKDVPVVSSLLIGGDGREHTTKQYVLVRRPAPDPSSRYGVTFEDHVIPNERVFGIASSTVKVLDLETKEVLGEFTRFAWSPVGPSASNQTPWLSAYKCPGYPVGSDAATRKFVDEVLLPRRDN